MQLVSNPQQFDVMVGWLSLYLAEYDLSSVTGGDALCRTYVKFIVDESYTSSDVRYIFKLDYTCILLNYCYK